MATPLPQYRVPLPEGHEIRVFLSSTFRDMDGERTALVNLFKRLRPKAAEHGVSITLVDLRWGIPEEESKSGKVIEICLDEIIMSRPFFIGLVGDRYGWCPTRQDVANLIDKPGYEWLEEDIDAGLSVTEIEMQYGVLRNPEKINACFFIKESAVNAADGCNDGVPRQAKLKANLLAQDRYPVTTYTSVEELETLVDARFSEYLESLYPTKVTSEADALDLAEQQRRARLFFQHITLPGRDGWIDNFVGAHRQKTAILSGPSGCGKSSLLVLWSEWRNWTPFHTDITIYHDITPAYPTTTHLASMLGRKIKNALLTLGYEEAARHLTVSHSGPQSEFDTRLRTGELYDAATFIGEQTTTNIREMMEDDSTVKSLSELSAAVEKTGKRFTIFIDNADLIESGLSDLTSFLRDLPSNMKVVIVRNNDRDEILRALKPRESTQYQMGEMTDERKSEFISTYLKRLSKRLDPYQESLVKDWPLSGNPTTLSVLLSELAIFGDFARLNEHIRRFTATTSEEEFYVEVLRRLCEDFGKDKICLPLLLLVTTIYGMSEDEIKVIGDTSQLTWSQLRVELYPWMEITDGYYRIVNPSMVKAVNAVFNPSGEMTGELRRKISDVITPGNRLQLTFADYNSRRGKFISQSHYHDILEYVSQLLALGDYESLYRRLLIPETFEILFRDLPGLLTKCWKRIMEWNPSYSPEAYADVDVSNFEPEMRPVILNDIGRFLSMEMKMPQAALAIGQRIAELNGIPQIAQTVLRMNQGCRQAYAKNYTEAIRIFEEVIDAQKRIVPPPEKEIANTYGNLAFAYYFAEREKEAIPCFTHVIDYYTMHQESESTSKIADAAHYLGHCYICDDNYPAAIPLLRKAIHLYDSMPNVPVNKKTRTLRWLAYSLHKTKAESEALEVLDNVLPTAMDAELPEDVKYCHKLYFYILQSQLKELKSQGKQDTPESNICYYEMLLHEWHAYREESFIHGKVRYVPLLRNLLDLLDDAHRNDDILRVFNTLDNGDFSQSPNDRAMIYHFAAMAAFRLENYPTALKYFEREYDYRKVNLTPDSYSILAMQNVAVCRHFTGDNPSALSILREALSLETELYDADTTRATTLREYIDIVSQS